MDKVDIATELSDRYLSDIMRQNVQNRNATKISPKNYCHNCYEDTGYMQLFCNDKCAKQYSIKNRKYN